MKFPERLRQARDEYGETQEQLAEVLQVTQRTISNWERGMREPPFETLEFLAERYNVTADWLLGRSPSKRAYVTDVGEIRGQAAQLLTNERVILTEEQKAEMVAAANSPDSIVIDPRKELLKELPKSREELEQFVYDLIEKARQKAKTEANGED